MQKFANWLELVHWSTDPKTGEAKIQFLLKQDLNIGFCAMPMSIKTAKTTCISSSEIGFQSLIPDWNASWMPQDCMHCSAYTFVSQTVLWISCCVKTSWTHLVFSYISFHFNLRSTVSQKLFRSSYLIWHVLPPKWRIISHLLKTTYILHIITFLYGNSFMNW